MNYSDKMIRVVNIQLSSQLKRHDVLHQILPTFPQTNYHSIPKSDSCNFMLILDHTWYSKRIGVHSPYLFQVTNEKKLLMSVLHLNCKYRGACVLLLNQNQND